MLTTMPARHDVALEPRGTGLGIDLARSLEHRPAICMLEGVRSGRLKIGLLLAAGLVLTGCGHALRAPEFRRSEGLPAGNQGASWESVLPGPAFAQVTPGPEYSRRDAALSYRPDDPMLASSEWPERQRPELGRWRTLRLPRDASGVIFFQPAPEDRGRDHHGHGRGWGDPYYGRYRSYDNR